MSQGPRLRQATKTSPLYPLNKFPSNFSLKLAENIVYHLATANSDLEGTAWERIFADCIGATWSPSNIGLDDIKHIASSIAWGAKTVKGKVLSSTEYEKKFSVKQQRIRLISGRNSINFSFEKSVDPKTDDANTIGAMVLDIYNKRVREVRSKFESLRTVILVKDNDLTSIAVFEVDTDLYILNDYTWQWNTNKNLVGYDFNGIHKFTWQPHGSQFTIIETLPIDCLRLQIKKPKTLEMREVLNTVGFNNNFFMKI